MTDNIKWSLDMTDGDFTKAAEHYFRKKYITLHEGICLIARVNPELKNSPVGEGYENWLEGVDPDPFDYTRRPFEVAIRAINGEWPEQELKTQKRPEHIENGKQVLVNSLTFFRWVTARWPETTHHIQFGLKLRLQRKKMGSWGYLSPKSNNQIKHENQRKAFFKLIDSLGSSWQKYSTHRLAQKLEVRLKGTSYHATVRTLTKRINECLAQPRHSNLKPHKKSSNKSKFRL